MKLKRIHYALVTLTVTHVPPTWFLYKNCALFLVANFRTNLLIYGLERNKILEANNGKQNTGTRPEKMERRTDRMRRIRHLGLFGSVVIIGTDRVIDVNITPNADEAKPLYNVNNYFESTESSNGLKTPCKYEFNTSLSHLRSQILSTDHPETAYFYHICPGINQ